MLYISTRDNHPAVQSSEAITLGMAGDGGLFVPREMPGLANPLTIDSNYQETARRVLAPFLSDFSAAELGSAIDNAYNAETFNAPGIVELVPLDPHRSVLELWHGPTAAFKDVALQIMPQFMQIAKDKTNNKTHTVILVATSGDTGKAALEGFRDKPGISIVVFYPAGGVSEIQKLQMVTTGGGNTHVVAVEGNFDDCQSGVKAIFSDPALARELGVHNMALSSANSINWGRLCPQIVYYVRAYGLAVQRNLVKAGAPVDFCVPTGNFGNILAGYYARRMGLPIRRLICASNRNRILADFFASGVYDCNREFYRTSSPSMDILISSNLERFLFEMSGRDGKRIQGWFSELSKSGRYAIDPQTLASMKEFIAAGWAGEERVPGVIRAEFERSGYVFDTHTAVAAAALDDLGDRKVHTIIDSTASPYKFSGDVLPALTGEHPDNEWLSIERLHAAGKIPIHRAVLGLRERPVRHTRQCAVANMSGVLMEICAKISHHPGAKALGH
ncbi:MAG: threonine synthase [Verrucomicrobiae bacterium]|nr:threonine synthase [Verrucomicrobiae bacterium]